jgi:stage V sporulation protein R
MTKSELQKLIKVEDTLNGYAQEAGLEYCDIEWDVIPDQKMFEIMAYRIPGNISNWKYGRDYERIRTINENMYDGLPYEVVINSDPTRAYLMKSNTFGVQCLVMAHVIGHAAFFKMNKYFSETRKDIIQILDAATKRFNEYEKIYGMDELERIIDSAHALQFHSSPFDIEAEDVKKARVFEMQKKKDHNVSKSEFRDLIGGDSQDKVKMDISLYNQKLWRSIKNQTPIEPAGDFLRYISDYSMSLEDWQKDVVEIMRLEGQYFWPQIKTKYMNEGFASYWHQKFMLKLFQADILGDSDHAQYNHSNSLVLASNPSSMNPYLIGTKMWLDIVDRWNKGKHGREWSDVETVAGKEAWDTKENRGDEKMLEVVKSYQDWFFMQDFLTADLVDELNLYVFVAKEEIQSYDLVRTDHTADQVRELIVASFANSNIPNVEITNCNFEDAGKQLEYAEKTVKHIQELWGREVVLECIINKKDTLIKCAAGKVEIKEKSEVDESPPKVAGS